jgi:ribulose-5-phosphate 4-epimerase/fuculose-1-phosphate aldolase
LEKDEQAVLARDFGDKWVMLLRNHGTLTLGRSVSQAFVFAYFLEMACKYQVATLSAGVEITRLPQEIIDRVADQITHFKFAGLMEWPALLATLDADDKSYRP